MSAGRVQPSYSYNERDDMGRDSPGALLDMLAEVASQTLHSEKKLSEMDSKEPKSKPRKNTRKAQQSAVFTVNQLLTMPASQLIKLFTVFSSDELKRHYTYSCALVPGCGQSFTSFASEDKARLSIQEHLAIHLDFLKNNSEQYASFTATAVKYIKPKTAAQNKKAKVQNAKKPLKETINKENKETPLSRTTNHLRKILSNEAKLKELEKNTGQEKGNEPRDSCDIKKDMSDVKVLGDHSYYETIKQDIINGESTSTTERVPDPLSDENIMLMVVDSNGVCMNDPFDTEKLIKEESTPAQALDMNIWKADLNTKTNTSDNFMPAKPKGKAKFIGTSKEEREMALILIEKIRKKGNPTGNNLQCRICDPPRSFTAPTTLVSHYRSHAGIKPYECRICRAVFTRRHSLKYHMLIHQNQTRFTCTDCGKKFRHPSHFREHRRRHTGEAPFGCEDCGQRFKTRNTYKRHLKTRHAKVLTISGELLHLSEEDSKKVKTKTRRKKQTNNDNTPSAAAFNADVVVEPIISEFSWEEQQDATNVNENNVDQCIDDTIWMYEDNQIEVAEENNVIENQNDKSPSSKTDYNETDVETNFDNDEVVIAQTDSNGALCFENYTYPQDTVYANSETIEFSCEENICTEVTDDAKQFDNQEETVIEYAECPENYSEEDTIFSPKEEPADDVYILGNEEIITSEQVEETKELTTTSDSTQTEESMQTDEMPDEQTMKIIPCQVKVCDSNGTATLHLLNNSKISLLGSKAQSINLIQNGKQHTFLLLASNDNNLIDIDNNALEGTKSVPIIAVPAE